ncbi:hypothetical protein FRC12_016205 [Ceratobasidium sp. 428]|nr:hypothetical protein FRC12_016205 [Ceratobasidium sp. 428]
MDAYESLVYSQAWEEHTIDTSDLVVPQTFPCFVQAKEGLKQHELHPDIGFDFFCFQISKVTGVPLNDLLLTYSMSTMKRGEQRLLTNENEFWHMMDEINEHYNSQITTICSQRLKEAAAAHNASLKGRAHAPKAPKPIPPLNLTFYNKTATEKLSGKKQSKAKEVETKPVVESLTIRMSRARDEIQKKGCDKCGKTCVLIPQANGQPRHRPLESQHIDLWAEHVARGLCTLSCPPDLLVVALADAKATHHLKAEKPSSDRPTDPRPTSPLKTSPTHNPAQSRLPYPVYQPQQSFAPSFTSPFPSLLGSSPTYAPPYFNMQTPFPITTGYGPPTIPFGHNAFPTYPHSLGLSPPPYQPSFGATAPAAASPWLSDWLPSLDSGRCGIFGDRFGALVSGFSALYITRVSHLHDYTAADLQQISFFSPDGSTFHISLDTATCLLAYAHKDMPFVDPSSPNSAPSQAGPSSAG